MSKPGAASPASHAETMVDGPESSAQPASGIGPESSAPDVLIGTTLHDTYIVDKVLGQGGMGRVYEARHTRIAEKRFAIKVLLPEFAFVSDIQARFQREVECVASVSHPGVIGIHDVGRTPQGWAYMVCEHLTGTDLSSHIKQQGKLPLGSVVHIGRRICEALEATHERGVIHRDLKPHNIFLVYDQNAHVPLHPLVKVLDFGLSRFVDKDDQLTKTGVVMGTPAYMSPEQAQGLSADHRTDVYGVGAILYAAATGHAPFEEETPQMTVLAVMSREPVRPRQVEPSVSDALEAVIQRAMAKNPDERYPDVGALKRALLKLQAAPTSLVPPPPTSASEGPSGDARVARLRLVTLLLAAFSLTMIVATTGVVGALDALHREISLTATERVLLLALLATGVPPLYLAFRAFKRRVWNNSARVLAVIPRLRAPLFVATVTYGVGALLLRFGDNVIGRLRPDSPLSTSAEWPGWGPILGSIVLMATLAMVAHQHVSRRRPRLLRWLFGPALAGAVVLCSALLAHAGLDWQRGGPPQPKRASVADSVAQAPALLKGARPSTAVEEPAPRASADMAPEPPARAPDEELAAAAAEGTKGLEALSERFPQDTEVLKALVLDYASRASDLERSLDAIRRLLRASPEHRGDAEVKYILQQAASRPGAAQQLAFSVMTEDMGSAGPDLMYDLMLKKPELEERARQALTELRLKQRFSPALAVAYDLRFAPSCSARLRLLERAEELGDRRSLAVLSGLASKPRRCGKRGQPPCRARCQAEAKQFVSTIEKISAKLRARSVTEDETTVLSP